MKKSIFFLICLLMVGVFGLAIFGAQADLESTVTDQLKELDETTGLPGDADDDAVLDSIATLIQLLLGVIAIIFFLLIFWAGFMWMTAAGNQEKVDKAKKMVGSGLVGLLIIVFSYAITIFVFTIIMKSAVDAK